MSEEKELVQLMCDIQDGLLDLNEDCLKSVELLILKCQNKYIVNYAIKETLKLFSVRSQNEYIYAKLIHELICSDPKLKEKIIKIATSDNYKYDELFSHFKFNDILRRLYDYGDISIDQIDFENCSFDRIKFFADVVPYYSSFTKSVPIGEKFQITKQLIYEHYYEDTIESYVKKDDVDNFSKIVSNPGFNIEEYQTRLSYFQNIDSSSYEGPNLANFAAYYGASKCFRYILKYADLKQMLIDGAFVIRGGNAEIIHLCDEYNLLKFGQSSLEYAEQGMHKDVLEWLINTKKIDYNDDLTEVDYLPNSAFIHYILNADKYHYNLSAMLFYSIERNYSLFVIKYLISLGADDSYMFYRDPPFEISQFSMDKAIEMKRYDIARYLKKMKFRKHKYYYSDDTKNDSNDTKIDSNDVDEQETIGPKKFTKLWREGKFKEMGKNIIDDIYTDDVYKIRFMIDNFNFCQLRFDCLDKNYIKNNEMMFDENENIKFNKKHGIINKEKLSPYDYDFIGLDQFVSLEGAWIYCEQAYDLYQKGKKSEDDSLCTLARDHIIDKMNDRMIDNNNYGKEVWQYFLDLMK